MKSRTLEQAVRLGKQVGHVFVVTADAKGCPHLAAAGKITLASEGRIAVSAWFCPGTVTNLQENSNIAVVVWDADTDRGYQILGSAEKLEDLAMMDGYSPEMEEGRSMPQTERMVLVQAKRIIGFSKAAHSDTEA